MKTSKKYTEQELNDMRQMKEQGATYKQIGEMLGRTELAVQQKFCEMGWTKPSQPAVAGEQPKQRAKLSDFTPREIIKYLYDLGYRIEDNRIVLVQKKYVNLKSSLMED